MNSPLVRNEVVSSVEPFLATAAGWYRACEMLRAVYFAFMAFKSAFVAEIFAVAGFVIADVRPIILVQFRPRRTIEGAV